MSVDSGQLRCPFCDFVDTDSYFLLQHVELLHPENGESPFIVKDEAVVDQGLGRASPARGKETTFSNGQSLLPPSGEDQQYVPCPYSCGESILSAELPAHKDLHLAETMAFEESSLPAAVELSTGPCNDEQALTDLSNAFNTNIPKSLRNYDQLQPTTPPSKSRRLSSLRDLFLGSPTTPRYRTPRAITGRIRRLGRSELGPYAHEKQMPTWLRRMLEDGAKVTISNQLGSDGTVVRVEAIANETPGLVPVLARLSHLDQSVERAFYCSPDVRYISKMPKEGGFCGYRNIQMLISYIREAKSVGYEHFQGKLPSILRLQDLIEEAWEMGFNSSGKIETGGIRLTRKYIGTPEAQALFQSLDIPCEATAFSRSSELVAHENLLLAVGNYFNDQKDMNTEEKVVRTMKSPIYFQHRGHSMTIVGLEAKKDGSVNLVVFDPMFQPHAVLKKLVNASSFRLSDPAKWLKAYRRGENYLSKYEDFELLWLSSLPSESFKVARES